MSNYYYHHRRKLIIKFPECVYRTPSNPNELQADEGNKLDEGYCRFSPEYTLVTQELANKICKEWYNEVKDE